MQAAATEASSPARYPVAVVAKRPALSAAARSALTTSDTVGAGPSGTSAGVLLAVASGAGRRAARA
ncbi:hypothetical protein, partial [Mycolicibacter algericus]|uniref:hypothetical protein n=1 Tax=Mycolicibacter algericus TaxID=1288388 RepID=UPI003C70A4C2